MLPKTLDSLTNVDTLPSSVVCDTDLDTVVDREKTTTSNTATLCYRVLFYP